MDFRGRHYTDRLCHIRLSEIKAAARQFRQYNGRFPRRDAIRRALDFAHREQERMAGNPLRSAVDAVDGVIARRCHHASHDSMVREAAILARHEGRPAVLARWYSPPTLLAANAVHEGLDLGAWIVAHAEDQRRGLQTYAAHIFECLVAVNLAGADAIETAQWTVAERVEPRTSRRAA